MKTYVNHVCHGEYTVKDGSPRHVLHCQFAVTDVELRAASVDIRPFVANAVIARLNASYDYLEVRDLPPFDESKVIITWQEATIDFSDDPKAVMEVTRPK